MDYSPWDGSPAAERRAAVATGIGPNADNFAAYIDQLVDARRAALMAGRDDYAFVDRLTLDILRLGTIEELLTLYNGLAPGAILAPAEAAVLAERRFASQLNSCPAVGADGAASFDGEGSCAWARLGGVFDRRGGSPATSDYDDDRFTITAGAQAMVNPFWGVGFAVGYEHSSFSATGMSGDGDVVEGGAVVKRLFGDTTLAASLSAGRQWHQIRRTVITPTDRYLAHGDPATTWLLGHLRASHAFAMGETFTVEPFVDVGLVQAWQDGYRETNAGLYGLTVAERDMLYATLNPALTASATFDVLGARAKATARAGVFAVLGDTDRSARVSLNGVGSLGPSFTLEDDGNTLFADLGVALEAAVSETVTFEANFDTLLSDDQQEFSGGLRLNVLF